MDNLLAETVSNVGTAATLRSYDVLRLGSGLTSVGEAAYDNVVVSTAAVPEPGAFGFAALGLGALLAARRFRK